MSSFTCPACRHPNPLDTGGGPLLRSCNSCGVSFEDTMGPRLLRKLQEPFTGNRCLHVDAKLAGRIELTTIQGNYVVKSSLLLCERCVEEARLWVGQHFLRRDPDGG